MSKKTVETTSAARPNNDKNHQLLLESFKNWPQVNEIFQTDDGTCFFSSNTAELHAKATGQSVTRHHRQQLNN